MKSSVNFFLVCAIVLVAPHIDETFAKGTAIACIALSLIFFIFDK